MAGETQRQLLLDAVLAADIEKARAVVEEFALFGTSLGAITDLVEPVLDIIGKRWETDKLSLAQGYVAAKVAAEIFERTLATATEEVGKALQAGPVVLGNIEDDYHALGRKMVATFLRTSGWLVHDLGNDVSAAEFVDRAVEHGARVIGVSAMTLTSARNIRKVREEINARQLKGRLQLAVGGAVFNIRPELAAELGADGTARNALGAPALFENLWRRSIESEGGR